MDTNQTDHMTVAISKLFNEKTYKLARNAIKPGTHDVPVLIHGTVRVEVGEDQLRKGTCRLPYTVVIAMLLKHAGYTKQSSISTLTKLFREAYEMDKDAAKLLMQECGLTEAMTSVQKLVADSLPPIPAKGIVRVSSENLVMEQRELTRIEAEALFPNQPPPQPEERKLKSRTQQGGN